MGILRFRSESASGSMSASGESSESAGGSGAAPALGALVAAARSTTLVRPPRPDVAPPAKLPRLRQVLDAYISNFIRIWKNRGSPRENLWTS